MKPEPTPRVAEIHLILVNDGTVLLDRFVMDDGCGEVHQRGKASDPWHLPPLGPVDEIVSKERPLDNLFSLSESRVRSAADRDEIASRSVFLQFDCGFKLCQFRAVLELFFEPCKVTSLKGKVSGIQYVVPQRLSLQVRRHRGCDIASFLPARPVVIYVSASHQHVLQRTEFFKALASSMGEGRITMLLYDRAISHMSLDHSADLTSPRARATAQLVCDPTMILPLQLSIFRKISSTFSSVSLGLVSPSSDSSTVLPNAERSFQIES